MISIECNDFVCERNDSDLFQPLNFKVSSGHIAQVAGPNGAGKTTLLRAMCGLFDQWRGKLVVDGASVRAPNYDMRCNMLYLGHQTGVNKTLTAKENLQWYFGFQGLPFPGEVLAALDAVGLAGYEDVPCHQMSAGQARRVALARLYVTQAAIWILDEPFTAIDKKGVAKLETLLSQHISNGGLVILTTHQPLNLEGLRLIELTPPRLEGAA